MHIYVDADACPKVIKNILYKTANRLKIDVTLVANRFLHVPPSQFIKSIQVEYGMDVADEKIVELVRPGDLVITADVPLANNTIEKGGVAINPRGEFYTKENIRNLLSIRNVMTELRDNGLKTEGPKTFSPKDQNAFANQLDRFMTQHQAGKTLS
ncbi:MAG: YaiI/YqxD family protein [SAR324 cluster bacterium]|nr:YaiI/YqxD family protein [SAR324 cluster bacterium]